MSLRKYGELAFEAAAAAAQRHVETERVFRLQIGIADFEREVARVRAEVIQLFERRIARRARDVEGDDEVVVRGLRLQQQTRPSRRTR